MKPIRVGFGYDVHQLAEGLPFIIGGVKIPYYMGLVGHSDADVLIHAICDALLGAASLRDIGFHFPDTCEEYRGIDSGILLSKVIELLGQNNWEVGNVDCTIGLQEPKISAYIPKMQQNLSRLVKCDISAVSVKATTTEHLGFVGRGDGIAVWAIALLYSTKE